MMEKLPDEEPEVSQQLVGFVERCLLPDECPSLPDRPGPGMVEAIALQVARQEGRRDALNLLKALYNKQRVR